MNDLEPQLEIGKATKQVHKLLQNLHDLVWLQESPWANSCLVHRQRSESPHLIIPEAIREALNNMLDQFAQSNPDDAALLRGHFGTASPRKEFVRKAKEQGSGERTFYYRQKRAIRQFTVYLYGHEQLCRQRQHSQAVLKQLPAARYKQLFGIDTYLPQIEDFFQQRDHVSILSIKGIGGIGKTSLAHYVTHSYIERGGQVHSMIWVSAQQQYLTEFGINGHKTKIRLEQIFDEIAGKMGLSEVVRLPIPQKVQALAEELRAKPYLVVLDNLETVEDFRLVTPWLEQLANPTRFILTTRETIPGLTTIKQVEMNQLSAEASYALILATAEEKEVKLIDPEPIYVLVGGNPLALILVVGLMHYLPLQQILNGIRKGTRDNIYCFLYQHAWSVLSQSAKELLLTIHRVNGQADWAWLEITTDLDEKALSETLQLLLDLSLIQVEQDNAEVVYSIHRLTSTFLCTEVLGWK